MLIGWVGCRCERSELPRGHFALNPPNSLLRSALESCSLCYASSEVAKPRQPHQKEARKTEASSRCCSCCRCCFYCCFYCFCYFYCFRCCFGCCYCFHCCFHHG